MDIMLRVLAIGFYLLGCWLSSHAAFLVPALLGSVLMLASALRPESRMRFVASGFKCASYFAIATIAWLHGDLTTSLLHIPVLIVHAAKPLTHGLGPRGQLEKYRCFGEACGYGTLGLIEPYNLIGSILAILHTTRLSPSDGSS